MEGTLHPLGSVQRSGDKNSKDLQGLGGQRSDVYLLSPRWFLSADIGWRASNNVGPDVSETPSRTLPEQGHDILGNLASGAEDKSCVTTRAWRGRWDGELLKWWSWVVWKEQWRKGDSESGAESLPTFPECRPVSLCLQGPKETRQQHWAPLATNNCLNIYNYYCTHKF